jgi:hypothetical protein
VSYPRIKLYESVQSEFFQELHENNVLVQSGRRAGLLIEKSFLFFYVQVETTARSEYISPNKMIRG